MALQAYLDSFNVTLNVATTTIVRSGFGFSPKAFLIWGFGRTESTDTVGAFHCRGSLGFGVSASDRRCMGWSTDDNAASGVAGSSRLNAAVVSEVINSTTLGGALDINSIDSDGITFIIDTQFTTDMRVHVLAFGGTDIVNAATGSIDTGVVAQNISTTAPGFQPSIVFFINAKQNLTENAATGNATSGFGYGISSTAQGVCSAGSQNASATSNSSRYCNDVECIMAYAANVSASLPLRASFVSQNPTGFTINIIESLNDTRVYYLAIKGGTWEAGNLATRTDGNTISTTGLQGQPAAVIFASHCTTESTVDTPQDSAMMSLGAATSPTTRAVHVWSAEDALSAAEEIAVGIEFDEVYHKLNLADGTDALMDVTAFNSTGFDCVMDDTEPSAGSFVLWVACENLPTVITPQRIGMTQAVARAAFY